MAERAGRSVAALAAIALLATSISVSSLGTGSAAEASQHSGAVRISATSPCVDVVFVGARGSGQLASDHEGLGPEVHLALTAYQRHMDGYSVGFYPVPYTAAAVTTLVTPGRTRDFFASIDQGVSATVRFLEYRQSRCGRYGEHYVLAGYSQGAMVMHRTLNRIADRSRPIYTSWGSRILPRLDGVLAIADGDRSGPQGGITYDTAYRSGAGVSWAGAALGVSVGIDRPQRMLPGNSVWPSVRFHSVCARGDIVCDYTSAAVPQGSTPIALSLKRGAVLHGEYYKPGGESDVFVRSAASSIARTSKSLNPPDAPLGAVSMRVNQTGRVMLAEDGGQVDRVQWIGPPIPGAVLSPGVSTHPATLTWRPTDVAVYSYAVRVHYRNGTIQDLTGTIRSVAVPPPSIQLRQVSATYYARDQGPYPQPWDYTFAEFVLTKSTASNATPTGIAERENPAVAWFIYISGDSNGNGRLDVSESWLYHGVMGWHPPELSDIRTRTLLVSANDRTGAQEWLELVRPITDQR